MLSGIYIYIYTIQIQRRFGFATSGLPISLSIEFSSNVPHCSEEISDRKLVSYPSNSTTPNPSYLQREWRADISLVNGSYIYIYVFLFFFFFFGVSSLRNVDDPLPFRHRESVPWENVKIVSINVSMKQEEGLRRKLGTDVWIIRIEIRLIEFIERIDRFDKIQSISRYFDLNWLKLSYM